MPWDSRSELFVEGFRKMSVKCLAEDYVIVEKEDKSYVYNSLYEDSEKGLFYFRV